MRKYHIQVAFVALTIPGIDQFHFVMFLCLAYTTRLSVALEGITEDLCNDGILVNRY